MESSPKAIGSRALLLLAALVTLIAFQFPLGRTLLYPFNWLATYAHEMGHGIAAMLMGADFERLEMFSDGSGLAHWRGQVGRLGRGFIAAGGLVGPSVAGALVLILSRRQSFAPKLLYLMVLAMGLSVVLVVRSGFGVVFLGITAGLLFLVARFAPQKGAPFLVQFIGVQLCLAVFRDLSYMFSPGGMIQGQMQRSDSAAIAEALFLPYWFWGGLTAAFSFAVLGLGLYLALKPAKTVSKEPDLTEPSPV